MTIFDLTNAREALIMDGSGTADFAQFISASDTQYVYLSSDGHRITLIGTGFETDQAGLPVAGTVTSAELDLSDDGSAAPDVTAAAFEPFAITDLVFESGAAANEIFWEALVRGATEFVAVGQGDRIIADAFDIQQPGIFVAEDDTILDIDGARFVIGDIDAVEGSAVVVGGSDVFSGRFDLVIGDASKVDESARMTGGNDTVIVAATHSDRFAVTGDVGILSDNAFGEGGHDSIIAAAKTQGNGGVDGDFGSLRDDAIAIGGDDTIRFGAGEDVATGDAGSASDRAMLRAGNDEIYGRSGDDVLFGDIVAVFDEASVIAGHDLLSGGKGDDVIFGDAEQVFSFLEGGNDTIRGGAGNDEIHGDEQTDNGFTTGGHDSLLGGIGDDTILGGGGNDRLLGQAGDDGLLGGAGDDTVQGGRGDDFVQGGAGNDDVQGGRGDDDVRGGSGDDVIRGGVGDDQILGQDGSDRFVFKGSFGQDTIGDFDAFDSREVIDLSAVRSIRDFNDLLANHARQVGEDVVIDARGGNTVTLSQVLILELDAGDFLF